jgi:hypothetical protein
MRPFILETSQGISVDLLRVNPGRVYVFEDTLDCSSSLGQAMVRGEPNACGIPVRKSPGLTCKAVFSDQDHEFEAVTEALRQLYRKGRNRTVVFPHVGIGHGPYGLVKHSPGSIAMSARSSRTTLAISSRQSIKVSQLMIKTPCSLVINKSLSRSVPAAGSTWPVSLLSSMGCRWKS